MARSGPKYNMTATQWQSWAVERRKEAERVRNAYLRQADRVAELAVNNGCTHCDPLISFRAGADGPIFDSPIVNHQLGCTRGD